MQILLNLIFNKVFISTAAAWLVAQVTKVIIEIATGNFKTERLTGGGGMPSSHSATVVGLVTSTAIVYGFGDFQFAMALFFAFVVIYDARGVRLSTGKEAKAINKLNRERVEAGQEPLLDEELDEKMGHTMPEIIVGIIVGIAVAVLVCNVMP